MNVYIKNSTKPIFICVISFLLLSSSPINATECGILQLKINRSSGINILKNACSKLPDVSSGSIFDLSPKGRLWLTSNTPKHSTASFQLICQNRTEYSLQIEFSDTQESPFLDQTRLNNCSGWTNKKLACNGSHGEQKGLYCILSMTKAAHKNSGKVERTTSVKMRGLNSFINAENTQNASNKQQILAAIRSDLQLCKALNQHTEVTKISWDVEQNAANKIIITSPSGLQNNSLSECVKTVVNTFTYPPLSQKTTFSSTF